jgi:hypothetical protein
VNPGGQQAMDEQRMQAYVALIEQLLSCANGEEGAILQQQAELVDAGLLGVMQQYADWLEQQGNSNNAGRFRQFAQRLATALGGTSAQTEGSPENADQFLRAVLLLVIESQGDAQQVYPFLAQHQDQLNETLLQTLPQIAAAISVRMSPKRLSVTTTSKRSGFVTKNIDAASTCR